MPVLTSHDFTVVVHNWVTQNEARIAKMWPLKGGWEGWAQAELAAEILAHDTSYDVLREQRIFTGAQEVDLLINNSTTGNVAEKLAIELKCQSFENWKNFGKDFHAATSRENLLNPNYQGCSFFVLGFAFTGERAPQGMNPDFSTGEIAVYMLQVL